MLKNRIPKIWLVIMAVLYLDKLDVSGEYEGQVFVDENLHVIEAEGFDESYLSKKQEYIDEKL